MKKLSSRLSLSPVKIYSMIHKKTKQSYHVIGYWSEHKDYDQFHPVAQLKPIDPDDYHPPKNI